MGNYYRAQPYKPDQKTPFKVSRSKIELFMQCPRCFWLDARFRIKRPSTPPFNINKAIDQLFKKEFDSYRAKGQPHPLMTDNKIQAIPFQHPDIDKWRENFVGVVHLHQPTNLHIFGAVDDVWQDEDGKLIVVDYKATAKKTPVKKLGPEGSWQDSYRRQMEIYQWLLKQNDFQVSDTGYFVYATASEDYPEFKDLLHFETHIFPHHGNSDWVEKVIVDLKKVLDSSEIPPVGKSAMGGPCEYCNYAKSRTEMTLDALRKSGKI